MSSNSNFVYTDNIIKKNHLTNKETNVKLMRDNLKKNTGGKIASPHYDPGYSMDNNASSKILKNYGEKNVKIRVEKDKQEKLVTSQLKKNKTMNQILDALFKKKKTLD
jgi:putative heme iron utilization protein